MADLPDVPNVVRFKQRWNIGGDESAVTIMHFKYSSSPPGEAVCTNLAASCQSILAGYCTDIMSSQNGLLTGEITDLSSHTGGVGDGGAPSPGIGTDGPLSPGTCVVFSHHVRRRYKGGHPRNYLPIGQTTDVAATGLWKDASLSTFQNRWDAFTTDVLANPVSGIVLTEFVNVSYYSGSHQVLNPDTGRYRTVSNLRGTPHVDTIWSTEAKKTIGSQRRRNRAA